MKRAKSHINYALLKYGYSEFSLEILEYCDPGMTREREQYYLDNLVHEYNILQTAVSNRGFRHSPEAIERKRVAQSKKPSLKGRWGSKVYVRECGTDNTTLFGSISAAAQFLGVRPGSLNYRKRRGLNTPMIAAAEEIKGKRYLLTFGESMKPRAVPHKTPESVKVKVDLKDLETGIITSHASMKDAATFMGIDTGIIYHRKKDGSVKPIKAKAKGIKGRLYRLILDGVDGSPQLRGRFSQQPIKVDLKDLATGLIVPYDSLEDAGEALGVDP